MDDTSAERIHNGELWAKLTRFAFRLTSISEQDNLERFVASCLRDLTGAEITVFSEYDPHASVTIPKWIEAEPGVVNRVVRLLGTRIQELEYKVTPSLYKTITSEKIGVQKTLHEVSFGAIPKAVGAAIQKLLRIDRFIGIAFIIEGKLYGTSVMAMKKEVADPPRDILEAFANLAAVSIRRHRAESELMELKDSLELLNERLVNVYEGERASFSQEIHFYLGQAMTALIMDAKLLMKKCDSASDAGKRLEGMVGQMTELAEEIQHISTSLYPNILDEIGLSAGIEWFCDNFENRHGIRCMHDLEDVQFSSSRKNLALYRIMQEALNNVEQHAMASRVDVELSGDGDSLVLRITDDGTGFDMDTTTPPGSLGIFGMKERAKPYGGDVKISSKPGEGTSVKVTMPLD